MKKIVSYGISDDRESKPVKGRLIKVPDHRTGKFDCFIKQDNGKSVRVIPESVRTEIETEPRIVCAETECEYFSVDGCTAEEINLTAGHMHTVHEGYRHVWTCRTFSPSPEAKEIFDMLKSYFDAVNAKAKEENHGRQPDTTSKEGPERLL